MPRSPPLSAEPVHPFDETDPVAAVLRAHDQHRLIALTTSGTTTAPRAIVRTTESWWCSFGAYGELTGVTSGARVWIPGPLSATMNLFAAVHAAAVGASIVDAPASASHACLSPTQLDRHGDELPAEAAIVVAGGPLSRRVHDAASARGQQVRSYYGAAELSFVAAGPHEEELQLFPGVEARIDSGVIWVASPYLAHGLGLWASVGDRGRLHGSHLVVMGRPGTATTAGATVALAEIETALRPHARGMVAVVALPHAGLSEIVAVACTCAGDIERLRARARTDLPASHRPRLWRAVPELPLTAAGKVDRKALIRLLEPA